MQDSFSRTRGAINSLTGGFGGLIPAVAGFTAVAAVTNTSTLQHEILDLSRATGLSAENASAWVGAAKQMGMSTGDVQMAFKFLSRDVQTAQLALDKHTASGAASVEAMHKVAEAQDALSLATSRYDDEVARYGANSDQALRAHDAVLRATDALTNAQQRQSQILAGLPGGASKLQSALNDLGVSLVDASGKAVPMNSLLLQISDGFQKLEKNDPSKALGDAMAIFSRGGASLLPLLSQGSAGIQQLMQNTAQAGQIFGKAALDDGEKTYLALNKMKLGFQGLLSDVAKDLQPAVQWMGDHEETVKKFAEAGLVLYGTHKGISIFKGLADDARDFLGVMERMLGLKGAASRGASAIAKAEGQRVFVTNWPASLEVPSAASQPGGILATPEGAGEAGLLSRLGSLLTKGVAVGGGVFAGNQVGKSFGGGVGGELGGVAGGALMGAQVGGPWGALAGAALGAALGAIQNWDDVKRGAQRVGGAMRDFFKSLGGDIATGWGVVTKDAGGFFGTVGSHMSDFFGRVGGFFRSLTPEKAGAAVHAALVAMFGKVHGVFDAAQLWVAQHAGQAIGAVAGFFTGAFAHFFTDLPGRIGNAQVAAYREVTGFLGAVGSFFHDLPGHLAGALKKAADAINNAILGLGKAIGSLLGSIVSHAGSLLGSAASAVGSGISSAAQNTGSFIKGLFTGGAQGGVISEPILGFGKHTGSSYLFGEAGRELIIPMSGGSPLPGGGPGAFGSGGAPQPASIYVDLRGTQVWTPRDLDDLVERIGSRLAKTLAPAAGVRLQRI